MLSLILAHTMANEIDHIQTGHTLLLQEIHCMRVFFTEDGDQHISASHFFFPTRGRLNVHDCTLNHTLESQGRLRIDFIIARHNRRVVVNEILELCTQLGNVDCASFQYFHCGGVIQQRSKQVLNRNEFMSSCPRVNKGHVQTDF